jgi:hypothetical protein
MNTIKVARSNLKVLFEGSNPKVSECVEFINEIFDIDEFWEDVLSVKQFEYTELTTVDIINRIRSCDSDVTIKLYRPFYRWSKANAYVTGKYPNTLFLNKRKLWRNHSSIVNTIFHECVHISDYGDDDSRITFGHGDNSSKGKENSAPYWIGELAGRYFSNEVDDLTEIEKMDLDENLIE